MSQITKRAISASLKHLLLQKPLGKITINDIAEDCGINRMTFYYHFKDIYDLIEWTCVEDASRALEGKKTYLYKLTYELLIGVVREKAAGMSVREEDMDFIATVYQYAFVGLMLDWIKNDMKGEPEVIVDRLAQVMHGNVTAALERLRIDKDPSNSPE